MSVSLLIVLIILFPNDAASLQNIPGRSEWYLYAGGRWASYYRRWGLP